MIDHKNAIRLFHNKVGRDQITVHVAVVTR